MKPQFILTTLLLASPAIATTNDDTAARMEAVRQFAQRGALPPLTQPFFDTEVDGTVWVRGGNYKASFDAAGATYYPIFGSDTPRHFPFKMHLASAVSGAQPIALASAEKAVRDGDRVTIDRGGIDEVYETSLAGIEQTFVVEKRPDGNLKLFVHLDTELVASETADGFVFANEYGKVLYGRAFVREANGEKYALATHLVEGGVEIDLSADYLARARFPLVIDPYIGQFGLTSTALHQQLGDISYDSSNNVFVVAFEEAVNVNDGDIRLFTVDATASNFTTNLYVDTSVEDWRLPSVANLSGIDRFLVCASVGNIAPYNVPGNQYRQVVGRGIDAANPAMIFPKFFVLTNVPALNNRYDVSVGGDETGGGTNWCVVWEEAIPGGSKIYSRLVSQTFAPQGTAISLSTTGGDLRPSVSKTNGGSRWNVVWNRGTDVYGAQLDRSNGSVATAEFAVANSALDELDAHAASPFKDGSWAAVWQQNSSGGERDLYCKVFSGSTLVAERNVSASNSATQSLDQRMPAIDCDGERIVVAYCESKNGSATDYDVYVSAYFSLEGVLRPSEIHVPITTSTSDALKPSIVRVNESGALGRRFGLSYTLVGTTTNDMFGALYDLPEGGTIAPFCGEGLNTTACPCGNNGSAGRGCASSVNASGALLAGSGIASLSNDTVALTGSGMPDGFVLYFQGTNGPGPGMTFGDGVRCTVGTIVRLGVKANIGGSSTIPSGSDGKMSVLGLVTAPTTHTYQGWYRDASVSFCTSATFNLTNALFVVWSS